MEHSSYKSNHFLRHLAPLLVFTGIWAVSIFVFWCFTAESDAMGFSVLFFYLILPVSAFISSFFLGRDSSFGHVRWILPCFYGMLLLLAEYLTFSLSNMLSFYSVKNSSPAWEMFLSGFGSSLAGTVLGCVVHILSQKKKRS